MTIRRGLLAAGVLGMCAVAPSRVRGATATEVEGAGYVGESPGSFGCGPSVRARYAGGAGRVRVAENDKRILGQGFSGELAGSIAREQYECVSSCDREGNEAQTALPNSWMGGGHLRGGYSNDNWSILGGISSSTHYADRSEPYRTAHVYPELEVGAGFSGKWRVLGGFGTPTLGTLRYPGLYIGGDFAIGGGEIQGRIGAHRSGPTWSPGLRAEVVGYVPLVPRLDLRLSLAGMEESGSAGGEASLGLRLGF